MNRDEFQQSVLDPLRRIALRLRACVAIDGLSTIAALLFLACALELLLDWSLRLRLDTRAVLLAAIVLAALTAVWKWLIAPLRVPFAARQMANVVERRFPELDALLISAVQFQAGELGAAASNSPQLAASVVQRAASQAGNIAFDKVIDSSRTKRRALGMVGLLALVVVAFVTMPEVMGTWFDRNVLLGDVQWPKRTLIKVDVPDGGIVGAIGDDLEIRARVADGYEVPRHVDIVYNTPDGKQGRETMTGVGQRGFRVTFPRVKEAFRFRLEGGDDVTDWFDTRLSERPRVISTRLTVTPPDYTNIAPFTVPEGERAVEMYPGSLLAIAATCNKTITTAKLLSGVDEAAQVNVSANELTARVTPTETQTYHFELVDNDSLRNDRPVRFSARIVTDESPKVHLGLPHVGNLVTPQAVIGMEADFHDDLGLADVQVMFQNSSAESGPNPIEVTGFAAGAKEFHAAQEWPIESSGAVVGDQLSVFARARDFDDISGPNRGESATITFRVADQDEVLADFARREQEYRRQFQRVVETQERIRGDLLTLLGRIDEPRTMRDLELSLAPLERRQRQVLSQVNIIRQQFEQLLAELHVNRLDTIEATERLSGGIIAPLADLGVRDLSDAADLLRRLGRERTKQLALTVDPIQARILGRMQLILDNMLKWEGYQETVTMLREILQLQEELNAETREEADRAGSDVFDD